VSDIFISYNNQDKDKAKLFATLLGQQGWSVFWDKKIPPGKTFDEYISEQLDAAKCIIVLWSKTSVSSDWVKEEAQRGAARKVLVPIFIEQVAPPLGFGRIEAAELFNWNGNADEVEFQNLLHAITLLILNDERVQKPSSPSAIPELESTVKPDIKPVSSPVHDSKRTNRKTLLIGLAGLAIPLVLALGWLTWRNSNLNALVPENSWGIVLGSDQSLKEANDEIDRRTSNSNEGIPKAKTRVYFRNDHYASITVVDNQDEANKYLAIAKTFGQGAYLTRMDNWCHNPERGDGFVICLSGFKEAISNDTN
jgi:hypothetical protein